MKIALIGPGAVGSVIAGALAGAPEIELAIGARAAFDRLVVTGVDRPVDVAVRVLVHPPTGERADVILFATKAHQTADAAAWLLAWADAETLVVVLQNGVEQAERVRAVAPSPRIVPAIVSCPARRTGLGTVELRGRAELIVPDDESGLRVAALFRDTYVAAIPIHDWITAAWEKLLFNAAAGAVTTLARGSNQILRDPEMRALTLALMHEVAAVARAEGAALAAASVEAILDRYLARAGNHTASITADRLAGLPTEWEARNGVVVRKAAAHGLAVPLCAALTTLLRLSEP